MKVRHPKRTIVLLAIVAALVVSPMALAKKDDGPLNPELAGCIDYRFIYDDGHDDTAIRCEKGKDVTDGHVEKLHVSCSDSFPDGVSEGKSELGDHVILSWSISVYDKDGRLKKECGSGEPDCPENLVAVANRDGSVSLSWDESDGATSYNIYRGADDADPTFLDSTSNLSYLDETTMPGVTYVYIVTAVDDEERESVACAEVEITSIPFFGSLMVSALAALGAVGAFGISRRRK